MRIAVFADVHLGDSKRTPQRAALEWAVREIERCGADAAAVAGDLTACGSMYAAMRAKKLLRGVKVPLLTVPGNSDLRTPETAPVMERLWLAPEEGICVGGVRVLGVDTARGTIDGRERARMEKIDASLPLILVSHQADTHVDADSRAYLADFLRRRNVLAWFTGHVHARVDTVFAGTRCLAPRALDPDKCEGGLPELLVLDTETGALESRVFDESLPCRWPWEKREALIESLGISLYSLKEDLAFCVENRVPHMEMRGVTEADAETRGLLAAWRKNGGWTLSQHLTKLGWDAEKGCVSGVEKFRAVVRTALECGADMVTVHPPEETVETMGVGSPAFSALADAMAEEMRPLARAGVRIVVENNHTVAGTGTKPALRRFGCTPFEILAWRDEMNRRLGGNACGLRLDVGHARNNAPITESCPLGEWYAQIGGLADAYHLHQTVLDAQGKMHNHYPITGLDDGLVSFHGFLWAWRTGVLRHSPVILEIRENHGAPSTWLRLRALLSGEETGA